MYCIMILSTMCIVLLEFSKPFTVVLIVFYLSAGFFAVFFTSEFMELSWYVRIPELWAGMGRAVNNITAAVIAGFVAICAVIYTLYNMPKALYAADVKTFKKGKEMDVYIKGNAVEKELYNQMNNQAKTATAREKAKQIR